MNIGILKPLSMFLDLNEEVNIILLPGPGVLTVEERRSNHRMW